MGLAMLAAVAQAVTTNQSGDSIPVMQATSGPAQPAQRRISLWQSVVLGVVEGLTEYLPVSSTGHLVLASNAMGISHPFAKTDELDPVDAFEVVIQLGAILAVLGLYLPRVKQMVLGLAGRDRAGLRLLGLLLVAFLPAAFVGLLARKPIQHYLFAPLPVAIALAVGGVAMIVVEHYWWRRPLKLAGDTVPPTRTRSVLDVTFWQAFCIGLAQCLALWPGTSRSMVTILAALVVGLDMLAAAEFSFLLALPTLGAATLYSGWKFRHELVATAGWDGLIVGLLVSAIVAAVAVKALVAWLTRHGLLPFGIYRIAAAGVVLWYFLR
jgi:undecaprenyl-diphosphatase